MMTRFEYISIFNGIIVALALENVAASFHKLFEAGARVRWHWMAPTNAIAAAIATLGNFWLQWITRDVQPVNPTFLGFLPVAATSILLYLLCAATLPDTVPDAGIDLKEFYFSSRRQFWSLVVVFSLVRSGVTAWLIVRHNFDPDFVRPNAPFLIGTMAAAAIAVSMLFVQRPWWHALGIATGSVATLLLFGPMRI
jgi:hypothetical protein